MEEFYRWERLLRQGNSILLSKRHQTVANADCTALKHRKHYPHHMLNTRHLQNQNQLIFILSSLIINQEFLVATSSFKITNSLPNESISLLGQWLAVERFLKDTVDMSTYNTHTYIHRYISTHTGSYSHTYIHPKRHTYIHPHKHASTHTYIHPHRHTYTIVKPQSQPYTHNT